MGSLADVGYGEVQFNAKAEPAAVRIEEGVEEEKGWRKTAEAMVTRIGEEDCAESLSPRDFEDECDGGLCVNFHHIFDQVKSHPSIGAEVVPFRLMYSALDFEVPILALSSRIISSHEAAILPAQTTDAKISTSETSRML